MARFIISQNLLFLKYAFPDSGEKREERGEKISTEFVKDNNEIF